MDFELSNVGRIHPEPPRPVRRGSLFPENLVLMADITLATLRARLGLGQKYRKISRLVRPRMNFRDIRGRKVVFVPHSSSDIRTANELLDSQSIDAALERNDYSRLAARESGIHKTTLFRLMR
jgi:hypothetical protein